MIYYTLIAVLLGGFYILKITITALSSPLKHLPGPWYTTWTSLPHTLSTITGRQIFHIHSLHQQYGPIVRVTPTEIAIADLESYQTIHKTAAPFPKTIWYESFPKSPRLGMFSMRDFKQHAVRRKLFARPFSKTSLRFHWEGTVAAKVRLAVDGIAREVERTGQADILKWWTFFATDVSGQLMFGESFGMLESGKKNKYIQLLELAMKGTGIMAVMPPTRILRYLPFAATKMLFNADEELYEYADTAVKNAQNTETTGNIFALALSEGEKESSTMDEWDIRIEARNLIVAGSDTTANTLTYTVWCVLKDRELRDALEDELRDLPDSFNDADLEKLPLLNATIEESLRLYGAAPSSLPREVPASGVTFCGHFIPGGYTVSTQAWTINRDPTIWEHPGRFDPYRFINAPSDGDTPSSAIGAFGVGSRVCIGIHLAWMELRYGLAYFLRSCAHLELSSRTTAESMVPENYFFITPSSHECVVVRSQG